jgi:hypothetical protein
MSEVIKKTYHIGSVTIQDEKTGEPRPMTEAEISAWSAAILAPALKALGAIDE